MKTSSHFGLNYTFFMEDNSKGLINSLLASLLLATKALKSAWLEQLWAHCYAQLMISPLFIDHLTCHLCFCWFSILMHLQEESSCAPPPPECKDQAFVPEKSTRDEVSLLVNLSKHWNGSNGMISSCDALQAFLQRLHRWWNKCFCF